jgi:hypothetical protein
MHSYAHDREMETAPLLRGAMRYFVQLTFNEAILRAEPESFSGLHDACGRAAEVAAREIIEYSNNATVATDRRLAVEIVDDLGNKLITIPINPAYH